MGFLVIRRGTLIDGTGQQPILDATILVKDSRIHSIGSNSDIKVPKDDNIEIDASGNFILPGFIDCHVHFCIDDIRKTAIEPYSYHFYKVIDPMRRTLEAGVTTVRDCGGTDLGMKRAVEEGLILAPRIQISVNHLSRTGGNALADGLTRTLSSSIKR